ncbi:MAG: cysteine--tRNA ligase [bacterium]|nr:cysteine--tRNA ligase [Acidimicrobiia bacterium]MCY4651108.1 cysteine--tRNA ligase [bacterium]
MRIFNTLTREPADLQPVNPPEVGMYVCGPTVQSPPHVGHGRSAVVFDLVRRYLAWKGFRVRFVRNITDVDDKIIAIAHQEGVPPEEHAVRITDQFSRCYRDLGVADPDVEPKATEHIPDMIVLIQKLIRQGLAYSRSGDVYFVVRALPGYGKLSGQDLDDLLAGARVEVSEHKNDPLDFALWKRAKPGEPHWSSPWGEGRPGWHIECSAMAARYLGETFDIHGGGSDLIFPHHENEIAQSEGATRRPFARIWMHNGMLNLGGEKMSKSTGHLVDLNEAIRRFGGLAVRIFYLQAHYRSPQEFSAELLEDARVALVRLHRVLERTSDVQAASDPEVISAFEEAMDDDLSTPRALSVLFTAVRKANRELENSGTAGPIAAAVQEMAAVLGLDETSLVGAEPTDSQDRMWSAVADLAASEGTESAGGLSVMVESLLAKRSNARSEGDYATADRIRHSLAGVGIVLEDTRDGTNWVRW